MVGVVGGGVGSASGPIRKAGGGGGCCRFMARYEERELGGGGGGGCARFLAQNEKRGGRGGGGGGSMIAYRGARDIVQ